jgi:hypothetical protein
MKRRSLKKRDGDPVFPSGGSGKRPEFTISLGRLSSFPYKDDKGGKRVFYWKTDSGRFVAVPEMTDYHIRQVLATLEKQGQKFCKWWYILDTELRARGHGMTEERTIPPKTAERGN